MTKFKSDKYRQNVAMVVVNRNGCILACERADIDNAWQIPQGGINSNETAQEAMSRELKEEIGIEPQRILACMPDTVRYDWPKELGERNYRGQEQIYFLVEIDEDAKIIFNESKDVEFKKAEWISVDEFLSRLSGFKKTAYYTGVMYFVNHYPQYFSRR